MKKNNLLKLLGIALVVAIVSTGLFYGLFVSKLASAPTAERTLVVAARALKPGTQLVADDVKTIPWSGQQVPNGFYGTIDQVTGNTVFDAIGEGEPIVASRLASPQSGAGSGVPAGMRAVSVHVTDSSGVMALLRGGQKVDVQVVVRSKDNPSNVEVRTALEDLTVLSVQPQAEASSQGATLPVITLLARPADADTLAAADAGARVRVTLRNPLDQVTRVRSPLTLESVMRTSGASNELTSREPAAGSSTASIAGTGTSAAAKP